MRIRLWLAWPVFLWLSGGHATAFIARILPLKEVLDQSSTVLVGRLESVDAEKRIAVGAVERALKGKMEFRRIQMNLGIGPRDHVNYLMPRLRVGEPFIIFYKQEKRNLASCVHAGDTWFQLFATDERDRRKVWWRLTHLEIYMGRTYNGSSRGLVKLSSDVVAGRVRPPKPNPSVPKLDPKRGVATARPQRVPDSRDGLEAVPGWYADDSWARPATVTTSSDPRRGKVMRVRCDGRADRKLALTLLHHLDLSKASQFALRVDNGTDRRLAVAVAFGFAPDWPMYETPSVAVPPGAKGVSVGFALTKRHFKCAASQWKHTEALPNHGRVDKVMLLVEGMPAKGTIAFDLIRGVRGGFQPQLEFPHPGGEVRGVSWADVNGDERLDALLCYGEGNVLILNEGGTFKDGTKELRLHGGSRAAAWADYDGDGHPDLLTSNFRLFTNTGGRFRDDSRLIQAPGRRNPEGAGWIDYNGDGRPDILITNGEDGIRLLENTGKGPNWFRDVSDKAKLGAAGLGRGNGDFIAFADYDGDGYTDFLYNLGNGILAHNEGDGTFALDKESGIVLPGGAGYKRGISFADYDNDGDLDLFVPANGRARLYRNENDGTFTDVIAAAGDLAGATEPSFAAAWGDVNHDGFLDLFVCHTRGASRLYLGNGRGKFEDVSAAAGVTHLVPAYAASFADVDGDGDLDLMVNLDRRAVLAINNLDRAPNHGWLTVRVQARRGRIGAVVRALDARGRPLGLRELNGAESCGGQASPVAHFGLPVGKCRVSVALSDGRVAQKEVTIGPQGVRLILSEKDFQ